MRILISCEVIWIEVFLLLYFLFKKKKKGRAVFAVLALGGSSVDVATASVCGWSVDVLKGFLASYNDQKCNPE